jgi:hypothetical protein
LRWFRIGELFDWRLESDFRRAAKFRLEKHPGAVAARAPPSVRIHVSAKQQEYAYGFGVLGAG